MEYQRATKLPFASDFSVSSRNEVETKTNAKYECSDAIIDEDITIWFLAHGANPDEGYGLDLTPLSSAVESATFDVIKLLFDKGGSVRRGQLLHHAAYRTYQDQADVLEYLVDKGLKVNDIMYQNRMPNFSMQKNWPLGTPLHRAAEK